MRVVKLIGGKSSKTSFQDLQKGRLTAMERLLTKLLSVHEPRKSKVQHTKHYAMERAGEEGAIILQKQPAHFRNGQAELRSTPT